MQELFAQPAALPGPTLSRQPTGGSLETVRRGPAVGTPEGRASTALRELLTYATQPVGLGRVLMTCDETNVGSRKAIEACGVFSIACAQLISCLATSIIRETLSAIGCQQACRSSADPIRPHTLAWPSVAIAPLCSRGAIQFRTSRIQLCCSYFRTS